jgi:signal transduction histidine kinase
VWSRDQRGAALQAYADALAAERGLAAVADCTAKLQREVGLLASGMGDDAAGLDDALVGGVLGDVSACRDHWRRIAPLAATGGVAAKAVQLAERVLNDWTFVLQQLGTNQLAAMTRLANDADPNAEALVAKELPRIQSASVAAMTQRVELATSQARRAEEVLAGTLALTGLALLGFLYRLGRRLEGGLSAISASAVAFGRGEFDHGARITGSDEFAQAGEAMHQMGMQLAAANQELNTRAQALRASLDQLKQTQSALVTQEKMAALGQLVAGVAHEVNTPLGVALTSGTMVQEQVQALSMQVDAGNVTRGSVRRVVEDATQGLGLMVANLRRAADLIQSFKQIAVDRGQTRTRPTAVSTFLQELLQSLSPMTRHNGVLLQLEVQRDVTLEVAAGELQQVLTNLVVNALVHPFPDPTRQALEARGQRPTVTVGATHEVAPEGASLVITVSDNGCGMVDEVAKRSLEPFFTTRRGQGGTGLGLHIAYSLVTERFAGSLDLTTAPDAGVCWTVKLPLGTPALQLRAGPSTLEDAV